MRALIRDFESGQIDELEAMEMTGFDLLELYDAVLHCRFAVEVEVDATPDQVSQAVLGKRLA